MSRISRRHRKRNIKKNGLPKYTSLGCPLTRNLTGWCFFLCNPDKYGNGFCGRPAPHGLKGRIQLGIYEYEAKVEAGLIDVKKTSMLQK